MKQKTKVIIICIVLCILAVLIGLSIWASNTTFLINQDGTLDNGRKEFIEFLRNIEDKEEREKRVTFCLEQNIITQKEADELY